MSSGHHSHPDTRKALIERLTERGYDALVLMQVKNASVAQDSDIYHALSHVAYSRNMMTCQRRAEVERRRLSLEYVDRLAAFLNYVLGRYLANGVEDLDRSKFPNSLKLEFRTFAEGVDTLAGLDSVVSSFV